MVSKSNLNSNLISKSLPMLDKELLDYYNLKKNVIKSRLLEFEKVKIDDYFYELCFCICTPQSKAENSLKVQNILKSLEFKEKDISIEKITEILRQPDNYIRFHNQKAKRLILIKDNYKEIENLITSKIDNYEKRNKLELMINGFGLKEASHFLRNIGYKNLAIFDRHILKNLIKIGLYNEIPKISPKNKYLELELEFIYFAEKINIPIDELDLLFWYN